MILGKASCGVRYAVRQGGSAVAYCALSIRCGTRDEAGYHSGIAHFTEHTLFKGTRRKRAATINNCLEKLGGELNAYTTKEEIVIHATVLKEDLRKAGNLLFELATEATFPEAEIETERGVVIDQRASPLPAHPGHRRFRPENHGGRTAALRLGAVPPRSHGLHRRRRRSRRENGKGGAPADRDLVRRGT